MTLMIISCVNGRYFFFPYQFSEFLILSLIYDVYGDVFCDVLILYTEDLLVTCAPPSGAWRATRTALRAWRRWKDERLRESPRGEKTGIRGLFGHREKGGDAIRGITYGTGHGGDSQSRGRFRTFSPPHQLAPSSGGVN